MQTSHSKKIFYILIFGSLFLLIFSILIYFTEVFAQSNISGVMNVQIANASEQNISNLFQQQNLQGYQENSTLKEKLVAKSYIIYDINSEQTVRADNANIPLPLASLTKVITVATLLDMAKQSSTTLREETKLIIKKALVSSSNEDADALGYIYSYSFGGDLVADSNKFLKEKLNIHDVNLTSLTGLDNYDGVNLSASNMGSAESMAKIFAYVYDHHREIFEYTRHENVPTEIGNLKNTNKISDNTFGLMASKTGFTWEAGGNLGIIISPSPGESYVVLVMGSTKDGRFRDMEKLTKLLPYLTN